MDAGNIKPEAATTAWFEANLLLAEGDVQHSRVSMQHDTTLYCSRSALLLEAVDYSYRKQGVTTTALPPFPIPLILFHKSLGLASQQKGSLFAACVTDLSHLDFVEKRLW